MRLNNKGYLLVEIIIASVLAMTIAYFLINITLKLKKYNDDVFIDTILITDKAIITEQIQNDLGKYALVSIVQKDINHIEFTYQVNNEKIKKDLVINPNEHLLTYGNYQKKMNEVLTIDNVVIKNLCYSNDDFIECTSNDYQNALIIISIPAYTIYSNVDYGINITIPYKKGDILIEKFEDPTSNIKIIENNKQSITA